MPEISLRLTKFIFAMVSFSLYSPTHADWTNWRGPDLSGGSEVGSFPENLDEGNRRWRVDLPGKGCSTPIVLDQTIFVTAPVDGRDAVLAIDIDGQQRWSTKFGSENAGKHRNGFASN